MSATTPRPPAWRILIAGGGIPSLALALALRQASGDAVSVTVAEPARGPDRRAYAVSPGSRAMLEALGIWAGVAALAQPIAAMRITDSRTADAVRPDYLRFRAGPAAPLGFMVEASPLAESLAGACREIGVAFVIGAVTSPEASDGHATVTIAGERVQTDLIVAADGARSGLREAAGIGWIGRRYRQTGLVATIAHAHDHAGVAAQHFLPGGPFAILPLAGRGRALPHRSSIVWTEEERVARALLADDAAADEALRLRFGPAFGGTSRESPLAGFPLGVGLARRFASQRLALLGDAAHEIHPLAGQGLNLGLADAAALAEAVVDAVRLGLDPGGTEILGAYEQARRFDAVLLATLTDGLNRLFSNDRTAVRALRDLGLGLVDRSPLRRLLTAEAAGTGARAPRLMRGEAL